MFKRTALYFLSGLLSQGLLFIFWFVISRYIDSTQIGYYNYVLYYTELLSAVVLLGGESIILRYYFSEKDSSYVFFHTCILTTLMCVFVGVLFYIHYHFDLNFVKIKSKLDYFCLPIVIFLNSLISLGFAHFTAKKEPKKYLLIQLLKVILFIICSAIFVLLKLDKIGLVTSNYIAIFISFLFLFIKLKPEIKFNTPSFKIDFTLIRYGIPLMIYGFVGVFTLYASRIMLESKLGLKIMGVYSFFLVISLQINGLWSSFNKSWSPEVYSKLQNQDSLEYLFKILFLLFFIFLFGIIVFFIVGNIFLFDIIIPKSFYDYNSNFLILLLFPLITSIYTTFYPIFYYENNTSKILFIAIISGILQCIILYFLIKFLGIEGASIGTIAANFLNLQLYLYFYKEQLKLPRKVKFWIFFLFITLTLAIYVLLVLKSFILFISFLVCFLIFTYIIGSVKENLFLALTKIKFI